MRKTMGDECEFSYLTMRRIFMERKQKTLNRSFGAPER